MPATCLTVLCLATVFATLTLARRPCNWRCNAPECVCVQRPNAILSECICAGEKGLGEKCLDDLQCSGGGQCINAVCTSPPQGPPQLPRWAYQDIFDKDY